MGEIRTARFRGRVCGRRLFRCTFPITPFDDHSLGTLPFGLASSRITLHLAMTRGSRSPATTALEDDHNDHDYIPDHTSIRQSSGEYTVSNVDESGGGDAWEDETQRD